jgi:hypothetical protein
MLLVGEIPTQKNSSSNGKNLALFGTLAQLQLSVDFNVQMLFGNVLPISCSRWRKFSKWRPKIFKLLFVSQLSVDCLLATYGIRGKYWFRVGKNEKF